jgi:hypothetical protein
MTANAAHKLSQAKAIERAGAAAKSSSQAVQVSATDAGVTPAAMQAAVAFADKTRGPVSGLLRVRVGKKAAAPGNADLGLLTPDPAKAAASLLGAREWDFVAKACSELVEIAPPPGLMDSTRGDLNTSDVNALLQAVSAFEPKDEVEAMFALQAVGMHHVSMRSLARAASGNTESRAFNLAQANKASRTFTVLVDGLNRHRGKITTQKVIVENVHVAAGGQAVVGAVTTGSGGGGASDREDQAHAWESAGEYSNDDEGSPMRSKDSSRQPLRLASSEGQEALPNARGRSGERRADRQPQQNEARPLERSGGAHSERAPRAAARGSRVRGDLKQ